MSIQITLNRIGVAAPVQRAAMIATDVIAAALTAFADNNLIKPTMPNQFFQFQVRGPDLSGDERRIMYENWLFAKGFQDLARGVRASLEEAALYLCLISNPLRRIPSSSTIEDLLQMRRKLISRLSFPELLSKVNSELTSPLAFEQEFISIQKVRNCLEHRDGVVRRQDLDNSANALVLNFPRIKFFYMRSGQEIELASVPV